MLKFGKLTLTRFGRVRSLNQSGWIEKLGVTQFSQPPLSALIPLLPSTRERLRDFLREK